MNDTHDPLIAGWNRRFTAVAAVGSVALVVLCAWFAHALAFEGFGTLSEAKRVILTGLFLAFGLLFVGVAITYALASADRAPVVIVDEAGVYDRRLSTRPVPWKDIESVTPVVYNGHPMLALNLADPGHLPLPKNPLWALNRLSARMRGGPELSIKTRAITVDLSQLVAAVSRSA